MAAGSAGTGLERTVDHLRRDHGSAASAISDQLTRGDARLLDKRQRRPEAARRGCACAEAARVWRVRRVRGAVPRRGPLRNEARVRGG